MTVALGYVVEIWYAIDIDDIFRRKQSQLHHRNETLAAGQQLRVWSKFLQQRHGLIESAGRVVLKAPRYHRVVTFLHRIDLLTVQTERFKREGLDHTRRLR